MDEAASPMTASLGLEEKEKMELLIAPVQSILETLFQLPSVKL